ncbi:phytanoyl-CoA dioxygenase family protein [Undibacterium sp. Tian12W]|uniref:phytanoyl-CoA dioxygenase family protein n=1 Tax=Undibacterium sp. Tian12W TaxID=3413054 RepID=UPI003BEF590C
MPLSDPQAKSNGHEQPEVSGLYHYWSRMMAALNGKNLGHNPEFHRDRLLLHVLGLGLEQTTQYLLQNRPGFTDFQTWAFATAGIPSGSAIARLHNLYQDAPLPDEILNLFGQVNNMPDVFSAEDLQHWSEHGFVVLSNAVPIADCAEAEQVIWEALGARKDDQASWYHKGHANIMVQLFQSGAFEKNRRALRIHKAFAQLWGTADLWATTDRCSFNVPEKEGHIFQGPDLHWDVSLQQPLPFATQGLLYLTDTPPEQGALTLVPGFHRRLSTWLGELPVNTNPREQDLHTLGSIPVGGKAGDLVIWQQALPHGSRPNRGKLPRIVQYINMLPSQLQIHETWL